MPKMRRSILVHLPGLVAEQETKSQVSGHICAADREHPDTSRTCTPRALPENERGVPPARGLKRPVNAHLGTLDFVTSKDEVLRLGRPAPQDPPVTGLAI